MTFERVCDSSVHLSKFFLLLAELFLINFSHARQKWLLMCHHHVVGLLVDSAMLYPDKQQSDPSKEKGRRRYRSVEVLMISSKMGPSLACHRPTHQRHIQ